MNQITVYNKIEKLLKSNNLPYEDIISSKVEFITSESNGNLVGCIGIEKYGEDGLLRSLVVDDKFKNKGTGTKLLNELISQSKSGGIKKLHLLTSTADKFFADNGFQYSKRSSAPMVILKTREFTEICPSSSIYMIKEIK